MKVNLLLAEAARVADGKLNVLGGGWDMISTGGPFAVCGVIDFPPGTREPTGTVSGWN